jgi:hypothetical protein
MIPGKLSFLLEQGMNQPRQLLGLDIELKDNTWIYLDSFTRDKWMS